MEEDIGGKTVCYDHSNSQQFVGDLTINGASICLYEKGLLKRFYC